MTNIRAFDGYSKRFEENRGHHEKSLKRSSTVVREYPGDLNAFEKGKISYQFSDGGMCLNINFKNAPEFDVSIRGQDIFQSETDVIVNAANTYLGGGGGIDGQIHRRGGNAYANAHKQLQTKYKGSYTSGFAEMITSGDLKMQGSHSINHVIVVAGPQGESTPQKESELYSCYFNSLLLAHNEGKSSIAFPAISVGIFHFPKARAAAISLRAVHDFIEKYPNTLLKKISIHFLPEGAKSNLNDYANAIKSHAS